MREKLYVFGFDNTLVNTEALLVKQPYNRSAWNELKTVGQTAAGAGAAL